MEWVIIWLGCGIASAIVANNKGRSGCGYFLLGFILGPIGLLISLVTSKDEVSIAMESRINGTHKICPYCAENIKKEAVVCRYCQKDLEDKSAPDAAVQSGENTFPLFVVGESFYQDVLDKICGGKTEEGHNKLTTAKIIPDFKNPHDSNAFKVEINGEPIGFISAEKAKKLKYMVGEKVLKCPAMITGGWKRINSEGNYGVKLDITW